MNAEQFAQFTNAMAGIRIRTKRPEIFSSGEGAEWLVWRANFLVIVSLNGWDDAQHLLRAKNEALSSITGIARQRIAHIAPGGDNETLANFLNRIQLVYLPAAASQTAKSEYDRCTQLPTETIEDYASRLRTIFMRAYPAQAADFDGHEPLIRKFMLGMSNIVLKTHCFDHNPVTYAGALELAQNKAATEANVAGSHVPGSRGAHGIGAMGGNNSPPRSTTEATRELRRRGPNAGGAGPAALCWTCGKEGHYARECRSGGRNNPAVGNVGRGRGRGRGRGQGARGRSGRGRGGQNQSRRINNIDAEPERDSFADMVSSLADDIDNNLNLNEDSGN